MFVCECISTYMYKYIGIYVDEKGNIFLKEQEGVYRSVIYDVMHIHTYS